MNSPSLEGTVVLVPGAWADGSCWSNVVLPLRQHGLNVTAAPIPLTSLSDDAAALRRVIARMDGPVTLAAHAYAGAVVAAVDHPRVRSLVYIAALAPDEAETVADVFYRAAPHPEAFEAGAGCRCLDIDDGSRVRSRSSAQSLRGSSSHHGGSAAANLSELRSGEGSRAGVEDEALVVFDRRGRSHDFS